MYPPLGAILRKVLIRDTLALDFDGKLLIAKDFLVKYCSRSSYGWRSVMDERSGGEPFRGHTTSLRDWVDLIGHAEVRAGEGFRQFRGLTASDRRVRGSKEDVRL